MNPTDQKTTSDWINRFVVATLLIVISIVTILYSVLTWISIFRPSQSAVIQETTTLTEEQKVNVLENLGPSQNTSDAKALEILHSLEGPENNFTNAQKEDTLKAL
jgi:hypothetical protein